jgi:hypothetical protein
MHSESTPNKSADSPRIARRKLPDRSRVTNGSDVLPDIDGRTIIARRYRDVLAALVADQGGADRLSEVRLQLCRRFVGLAVQAEALEGAGQPVDINQHATIASTLVRLAGRLGLDRAAKEVETIEASTHRIGTSAHSAPPCVEKILGPPHCTRPWSPEVARVATAVCGTAWTSKHMLVSPAIIAASAKRSA